MTVKKSQIWQYTVLKTDSRNTGFQEDKLKGIQTKKVIKYLETKNKRKNILKYLFILNVRMTHRKRGRHRERKIPSISWFPPQMTTATNTGVSSRFPRWLAKAHALGLFSPAFSRPLTRS